jgi:hypothetical protein
VLFRRPPADQWLATPEEGAPLVRLGVGPWARRRTDHVGTVGQGARVQRLRFRELPRGPGTIPDLTWVHDHHGQTRRGEGAGHRAFQTARGCEHHEGRFAGLDPVHEQRHPAGIVRDGPPLPGGASGNIPLGFGHIKTNKAWHVTQTNSCSPDLAQTGSMAPHNGPGSGSPGRDDPRSAPVSVDQGCSGLSRPGHCMMGILPHHPLKIQGYWRSLARGG